MVRIWNSNGQRQRKKIGKKNKKEQKKEKEKEKNKTEKQKKEKKKKAKRHKKGRKRDALKNTNSLQDFQNRKSARESAKKKSLEIFLRQALRKKQSRWEFF